MDVSVELNNFLKAIDRNAPLSNGYKYPYKPALVISIFKYFNNLNESIFNRDISLDNNEILKEYYDLITSDVDLYDQLIKQKSKKDFEIYLGFNDKLKKQLLNKDEMHIYDMYVNPIEVDDDNISFEEAKKEVLNSLNVLGKEYISKQGAYPCIYISLKDITGRNYEEMLETMKTMVNNLYKEHRYSSYYSCPGTSCAIRYASKKIARFRISGSQFGYCSSFFFAHRNASSYALFFNLKSASRTISPISSAVRSSRNDNNVSSEISSNLAIGANRVISGYEFSFSHLFVSAN